MMKWTGSAIAVAAVMVAAAMMPTLKAAEETPMITVYEANVTDMDGYKNQFLTALQPKIDKAQERWLARGGKTTSLIGKAPENRVVMSMFSSKASSMSSGPRPRTTSRSVRSTAPACASSRCPRSRRCRPLAARRL
jgi:uncharacterized protein (DUF1330 family)